jgi:ribosomal protein S18 acetylase RimI-like enzyme
MEMRRVSWMKVSGILLIIGFLIAAGLWLSKKPATPIIDFNDARDTKEILKIFERDRYWLLASEDYSPEFMLKYRAPNQDIKYMGRLHIKVWWEQDKFVGFSAYYMKTPTDGFLLFLDVNPEFRGKDKGYAEKLVKYVLGQLRSMGAEQVQLCTRTDNMRAQKLYNRVGFYEISRDNGFMYFQYDF